MWAEINGERKKVACGPCIRGHRSSKCDHRDRVLVEVRKPGRPLSSCPHPSGSCSCERLVISYTIPKSSACACPSESSRDVPVATLAGPRSRVQKSRNRRPTNNFTPASLEKAIKATENVDVDSSSLITTTPTNPSFPPSEDSLSNGPSAPSSASSTPFIFPSAGRRQSQGSDIRLPDASVQQPATPATQEVSSCCKPKLTIEPHRERRQQQTQGGSCCGGRMKVTEQPKPVIVKKSCCSGSNQTSHAESVEQAAPQSAVNQAYAQHPQFQHPGPLQGQTYTHLNHGFMPPTGNIDMSLAMNFSTPIYNHMASSYPQSPSMPMQPLQHAANVGNNLDSKHNCDCGDSCSCFGCADHPKNATMYEYTRNLVEFMGTGAFGPHAALNYDIPAYPHQPGYGAEASYMNFNGLSHNYQTFNHMQIPLQSGLNIGMGLPSTAFDAAPWNTQATQPTGHDSSSANTNYYDSMQPSENIPLQVKTEAATSGTELQGADSPEDGKDEDTPTLSPSTYVWQEIELQLPGCDDPTGTCQCGDGCACVGCLTHGGHNGVPLDTGPTAEQDMLNNLVADNSFSLSGTNGLDDSSSITPT